MRRLIKMCLLGAAWLAFPAAAAAQDAPPVPDTSQPDGSQIVVTGTKDMEGQIRDFVGALTPAPPRTQLSRFEWAVCPAAIGLSPAQEQAVVARMRRVAQAAGLRVGGPHCLANVLVMVTDSKQPFIEMLARKYGAYFGDLSSSEVRRLAKAPGGAAAWQLQGPPIARGGAELQKGSDPGTDFYVNRTTARGSRIVPPTHPQFDAAAVVIERSALVGLTTTQLADYAAMRTFAKTDPSRLPADGPPTILKILDAPFGAPVPPTLTQWDLSFLSALYASDNEVYAASQRSDMRERVRKELQRREDRPGD